MDFTKELAELLDHISRTATAIRMHSAYTRQGAAPEAPEAQYDLLWLSDSLHNFDYLSRAIRGGDQTMIQAACGALIKTYKQYAVDSSGFDSKAAFERAQQYDVNLDQAINIFQAISKKADSDQFIA
jgi:hypothetical protein